MASSTSFLDAVANRRSIYALNKTSPISDDKLESIVTQVLYPPFESISKKVQYSQQSK
jgi:predicted oxidoreductase (fatty acid repression mutant protein)